ncbi:MAG: hypothetical protein COW39_02990 [Comamonadaceae bacterium CG17_big_fil_post_rev_8_21_14_2_50_60_13]|nr:MAG: hypothetical protein COW39_02990 [Comamonadaceae bacterium CG17_big_fil_post_rev_8_21_14_2_50_60_13]
MDITVKLVMGGTAGAVGVVTGGVTWVTDVAIVMGLALPPAPPPQALIKKTTAVLSLRMMWLDLDMV